MLRSLASLALFSALLVTAFAGDVYVRGESVPWATFELTGNEQAMDTVLGPGNWSQTTYADSAAAIFAPSNGFVFMEGGDSSANEVEAFLDANLPLIEAWVTGGGRLLISSAPNEGDGMALPFGATLNYPDLSLTVTATDAGHPVWSGPYGAVTSVAGDGASHASLSAPGFLSVGVNGDGNTTIATRTAGTGRITLTGLTTPFYHSTNFSGRWGDDGGIVLHNNLVAFAATPVPEPASMAVLGLGLAALKRRRNS